MNHGQDQADNSAESAGAVYVFTGSGTAWSQQAYIKGSAQARKHYFGLAIDLDASGDTLVVGASGGEAAYVFRRSVNTWSEQAVLRAVNYPQATGGFGDAVAISADGNTVAVTNAHEMGTARGVDGDPTQISATQSGATYLLTYSGGSWQPLSYIKATNVGMGSLFGFSVDLSADATLLAVGDQLENSAATGINGNQEALRASYSGAAYVYRAFP